MQNNQVRIGIISTAEIAHKICSAIHATENCVAYAVASRTLDKAKNWAKVHKIPVYYGSYEELLADPNVDAVYLPLPTFLKKQWTIKAAQAKKHVLVENPLPGSNSADDVREMLQACRENNVQFLDGTIWLHAGRITEFSIKKQEIGEIRMVNSTFTFKAPNDEWIQGGNKKTDKQFEPLGCLGDQGWYCVSSILYAYDYELPQRVKCLFSLCNTLDTMIQFSGCLEFSGQRFAYFDCGFAIPFRSTLEIVGSKGALKMDDLVRGYGRSGKGVAYLQNLEGCDRFYMEDEDGSEIVVNVKPSHQTQRMINKFVEMIKSGQIDETWMQKSLGTQKILIALFRSSMQNNEYISMVDI